MQICINTSIFSLDEYLHNLMQKVLAMVNAILHNKHMPSNSQSDELANFNNNSHKVNKYEAKQNSQNEARDGEKP